MSDWKHIKDTALKARKAHGCFLCGEAITPGESYVKRAGTRDGGFRAFAMHAECEAETRLWDEWDWDHFDASDFKRPSKASTEPHP